MRESGDYIWVIGSSSGIGHELAKALGRRGHHLALSARDEGSLSRLRDELADKDHLVVPLDVRQPETIVAARDEVLHRWGRFDRVIYMAGAYEPMELTALDMAATRRIMEVNLLGAFYVVGAVLDELVRRERGQLVLCGSVAGYRGLPGGQPYGATKAGLMNLAESLRAEVGGAVDVRLVSPGFVESRLTAKNEFAMPFRVSAAVAGEVIARGLEGRGFEIHFPKRFTLLMKVLRWIPDWIYYRLVGRG